jgi:hypothetical protein
LASASLTKARPLASTMAQVAIPAGQRVDQSRMVHVAAVPGEAARKAFAVVSALACIGAGVWAMASGYGSWYSAAGLYFIGKGLFVGPMLYYR